MCKHQGVARSLCTCGAQILWKADEARSDEWVLVAKPDVPDELDRVSLAGASTTGVFCPSCGRLWIDWGRGSAITEYVPVDPDARPVRRPPHASDRGD